MGAMADAFHSPSTPVEFDLRHRAELASNLGLVSIVLALVSYCSGYLTLILALPVSLYAMHLGRTVLAEDPDEVTEVLARNAVTLAAVSTVFSAAFMLLIALVVLLYLGVFTAALVGGL